MDTPLVSIIIPVFNRVKTIGQALDSLLAQTFINWEAIVVDDGSADGSIDLINSYLKRDKRIRLLLRERLPKGAPTCRNIGFSNSKGAFIIFLDSDDLLAPNCLEGRLKAVEEEPGLDYYVFPLIGFREQPGDSRLLLNVFNDENDLSRFIKGDIPWGTASPLWKREALEELGGWDENAKSLQDWEFHIRALVLKRKYQKFDVVPDVFMRRNRKAERISTQMPNKENYTSRILVYSKIVSHVLGAGYVEPIYKLRFARFFLLSAEEIVVKGIDMDYKFPIQFISSYNLLSNGYCLLTFKYLSLLDYLSKRKHVKTRTIVYKAFRALLPKNMARSFSNHEKFVLSDEKTNLLRKQVKGLIFNTQV